MKLIIAGGRDYHLTLADIARLDALRPKVTEVVSGASKGFDGDSEVWATRNEIPITFFPADWKYRGSSAGPIRNQEMVAYADAVALFPGGKGTENMHTEAVKAGIQVYDFREPTS
jgi:hypothetical protein